MKIKSVKVFRWLWRINSVLIFLVGIGVCGFIITGILNGIKGNFKTKNSNTVRINSPTGAAAKFQLSYGKFGKISGTSYLMSPLRSEQEYTNFGYGSMKEQNNTAVRNYLFFNSADKSSRWLLPHNDFLFVGDQKIPRENKSVKYEEEDLPIAAIFYELIKTDTNGDGKMNTGDKRTIGFSDAGGGNFVELVSNVDEVLDKQHSDENNLLIFYKSEGEFLISQANISERKIVATTELPPVQ